VEHNPLPWSGGSGGVISPDSSSYESVAIVRGLLDYGGSAREGRLIGKPDSIAISTNPCGPSAEQFLGILQRDAESATGGLNDEGASE